MIGRDAATAFRPFASVWPDWVGTNSGAASHITGHRHAEVQEVQRRQAQVTLPAFFVINRRGKVRALARMVANTFGLRIIAGPKQVKFAR
jgi:hypothetical protein